jgi:DNA-binding transcriptional LysR family regulator
MLDVRRLRVLREVAVRGSIAAAAEALSFTPSAVSQQLKKLESETGLQLLRRTASSVTLTEAGKALVEHTEGILDSLAEAEADLDRLAGMEEPIRLGSITTAAVTIVPEALKRYASLRPGAEVRVVEADPLASLAQLRARELDLAIVFEYDHVPLPLDDRLEVVTLLEEPIGAVLPAGHPAARRRAVRIEELAEDAWIKATSRSSCHEFTARTCRAAGFEPRIVAEFDDYAAMQNSVAAGVGVAFAPDLGLTRLAPGVEVRPIAFAPPHRRILVAARRGQTGEPGIAAMFEALRATVAAREPTSPAAVGAG